MTNQFHWFSDYKQLKEKLSVKIANNKIIPAIGKGTIYIEALVNGIWLDRKIENVLYIPELKRSLFSVGVMTDKNFTHVASRDRCEFKDSSGEVSCMGIRKNNLWYMQFRTKSQIEKIECSYAKENSLELWHQRLAHINIKAINDASKSHAILDFKQREKQDFFCEACRFGKQTKVSHKSIPKEEKTSYKPGEKLHSDVCGPMNVKSPSGSRYFVVFKDECTKYRSVFFMKHKSEVLNVFKTYKTFVEKQTGNNVKILKTDGGTEYINNEFRQYLEAEGILHEQSSAYTPQQNGSSEREIRTIVDLARTMLINRNVPTELWAESVSTATYILNRTSINQQNGSTANEQFLRRKPELSHLRVFGCNAYATVPNQRRTKWNPKSKKLMFVGYDNHSNNYRLWDATNRKITITCDVVFDECSESSTRDEDSTNVSYVPLTYDGENQNNVETIDEDEEEVVQPENEPDPIIERRELRDRANLQKPDYYGPAIYCSILTPESYEEARNSMEKDEWNAAMKEEIESLENNKTWTLVPRPENVKLIDNKWVYRVKTNSDGDIVRYKARLVAKGYTQQKGIDFAETFAPVVRYDSIRILLALAAQQNMKIKQFDVQTAFLYGDLQESIYMKQPPGFEDKENPNYACKLHKSLYGLKQSSRCWNEKFVSFLKKHQFEQSRNDQCVFYGKFGDDVIYLALYVDDGLLMSRSCDGLSAIIESLRTVFNITVSDSAEQFVGLEIDHDFENRKISIRQRGYIRRILEKFNMTDAKISPVPAEPNFHLEKPSEDEIKDAATQREPYREAVGSLIFLATVSRPDIAYSVGQVSRFLSGWSNQHWLAVKKIFRYLKSSQEFKITYEGRNAIEIRGYTDADYAGCKETRKSTSGYIFFFGSGPITWTSQKQTMVAQSTTEAEYIALALGGKEALWLNSFIKQLC